MELCNLAHATVINHDGAIFDASTNTPACARSTNKATDLGEIAVVLSDKTGTLTRNVMTLTKCSIGGRCFQARAEEALAGGRPLLDAGKEPQAEERNGGKKGAGAEPAVALDTRVDVAQELTSSRLPALRPPVRSVDGKELMHSFPSFCIAMP